MTVNAAFIMKAMSLFLLAAFFCAVATPAKADTYLGPQVIIGQFSHNEANSSGNLQFTGLYGLFELWHTERHFDAHVEGIPVWSPWRFNTNVGSTNRYAAVGAFDAVVHGAVDPHSRVWVGAGLVDFNDRIAGQITLPTPFGPAAFAETSSSHLSGARYELRAVLPAGKGSVVELQLADMPSLDGSVHIHFDNPMIGASDIRTHATAFSTLAAYGWKQNQNEYLVGWRSTNYPVTIASSGQFVFRNTIGGVYFEARFRVSR
jgi:hypothetical protein